MTIFESLEVAPAIRRESLNAYQHLPAIDGPGGKKVEDIRLILAEKRRAEVSLWNKIISVYSPSE